MLFLQFSLVFFLKIKIFVEDNAEISYRSAKWWSRLRTQNLIYSDIHKLDQYCLLLQIPKCMNTYHICNQNEIVLFFLELLSFNMLEKIYTPIDLKL